MSDERFRGDPYRVLGVAGDASASQIKRRWRELAREHHPDRAAGDREEAGRLTARMARINAARRRAAEHGRVPAPMGRFGPTSRIGPSLRTARQARRHRRARHL
jgi:molecular chaperone DnaJ